MFMLSMGTGMNQGTPDVCLTPAPPSPSPVPVPYPDISMTSTTSPVVNNVLVDCMPTVNKMSMGMVSNGDEAGVAGGVVSHLIDGQTEYIVGCITILVGGAPAQRLTSVTGQNAAGVTPNTVGMSVAPSQTTVLTLG